jgi:DnaJ domain
MALRSHYELLGVAPDADADAIKAAYRKLTRDTHPDRPTGTNGLFGLITDAYEELRDPARRAAYDRNLARGETSTPGPRVQHAERPRTAAEDARAAAEFLLARDQALADIRRAQERQRCEENVARHDWYVAEQHARHPPHLWLLMGIAVFVGYFGSYNLVQLTVPPDIGAFRPHGSVPFGVALLLVLRALLLLLVGGFLIARRNYMAHLSQWAVAGICVTWGMVTVLAYPPAVLLGLPMLVFVAVIGTGVYAQGRFDNGFGAAAWATTKETAICAWDIVRSFFSGLLDVLDWVF